MRTYMPGGSWRQCERAKCAARRNTLPILAGSNAHVRIGMVEGVCARLLDCWHRVRRTCDDGRQNRDDREKDELFHVRVLHIRWHPAPLTSLYGRSPT